MYDFAPMLGRLPDSVDAVRQASQGIRLHGLMPLQRFTRLRPSLVSDDGEVEVELAFAEDTEHRPFVTGTVRGALQVQCQRCFQPLTISVEAQINVGLVRSDDEAQHLPSFLEPHLLTDRMVSLTDLVEDELILALPIVPRHDNECAATRASVGDESAVADEQRKNPFAVLAQLRDGKDRDTH